MDDDGRGTKSCRAWLFGIDDSILFTAIDEDLKPLLPRLEALAREHDVT